MEIFDRVFDGFGIFGGAPLGVFGFVVLLALIGGVSSWLKVRAVQETIQAAIQAGTPLDPATIRELKGTGDTDDGPANYGLVGLILLAVAAALIVFGAAVGLGGEGDKAFYVFIGIAAFPGLIGVAFLIANGRQHEAPAS